MAGERGDAGGLGADHDVRSQPIGERRARDREGGQRLRNQWPILAAGALSTISGVGFAAVAVADGVESVDQLIKGAAMAGRLSGSPGSRLPRAGTRGSDRARGDALAHLSRSVRCLG